VAQPTQCGVGVATGEMKILLFPLYVLCVLLEFPLLLLWIFLTSDFWYKLTREH